jgi:hypothetical protein
VVVSRLYDHIPKYSPRPISSPIIGHTFEFKTDGSKLTGKITILYNNKPRFKFEIKDGIIDGNSFSFTYGDRNYPKFVGTFFGDKIYITLIPYNYTDAELEKINKSLNKMNRELNYTNPKAVTFIVKRAE